MEYPIKDIVIERIASFDTKKDGSPMVTKAGKPFKKVLIDVDSSVVDDIEFNGTVSMLDFDGVTDNWQEGDKITGKIIRDGDWWNFELPSKADRITELEEENKELKRKLEELESKPKGKIRNDPDEEITADDLPF